MKKVYLAGAIRDAVDPFTWRKVVAKMLPEGWESIDPLDLGDGIFNESQGDPQDVITRDFDAIVQCRAILARIDQPSWGTGMEIRFARERGIPVAGWTMGKTDPVGPWLRVHTNIISHELPPLFEFLKGLD